MIQLKIVTPLGVYLQKDVDAVHLKTIEGERTLLPNHIPLVAMIPTSKMQIRFQNEWKDYAITKGLLHMNANHLVILADTIEAKEEIDIERAKRARERANKRLQQKEEAVDMKRAQIALAKALNRISLFEEV